jgi:hypothetical protein
MVGGEHEYYAIHLLNRIKNDLEKKEFTMFSHICSEKHGYLSINLCESFSVSQSVAP